MTTRKPTIALLTLATTLTTGLAFAIQPSQAQVWQFGRDRSPAPQTVQPHHPDNYSVLPSASGQWQGGMHSKGDDAVASVKVQIKSSPTGYQGTWQLLGAAGVLKQGILTGTQQGQTINLKLEKFNGNNTTVLNGTFKANGKSISGQVANSTFVFFLNKL
jgi:hypothetical protein